MNKALVAGVLFLTVSVLSCTQKEIDDLAKAQQCLDQVPSSAPAGASNCLQYVNEYSSQRANILKCSIYLTAGGITTDRVAQAYIASQDNTVSDADKQGLYVSYLALTLPDPAGGYAAAQTASTYCNASGEPGLMFLSTMAVMGSMVNNLIGGSGIDLTDTPANITSAVQTALATCQSTPTSCDPDVIAPAAISAANSYCNTANANSDVCADINQAVTDWGSDNDTLTQGLMCMLAGKTFTPPATCL